MPNAGARCPDGCYVPITKARFGGQVRGGDARLHSRSIRSGGACAFPGEALL